MLVSKPWSLKTWFRNLLIGPERKKFSKIIALNVLYRCHQRCFYCDKQLNKDDRKSYHIDHIKPVAKRGKSKITNYCATCPACNLRKSDMRVTQFLALKQFKNRRCRKLLPPSFCEKR
jgi:CRISPR/Cas system Type II protein with McrA/HNH and RuvC-like nuclease domain